MVAILISVLTSLPWATIIKFVFGMFKDKGISEPGISPKKVGNKTSLFSTMSAKLWMLNAQSKLGTKEIVGRRHNKDVLKFHQATTLKATTDEVPWCSSFVCWVLEKSGIPSTRSARAKSYVNWGRQTDLRYGAVVVFNRGNDKAKGHVGFYVSEDKMKPGYIKILGGNQSNSVNVSSYPIDSIAAIRWPLDE